MLGTVRTRSDEEIGEETKKPKLRCLNGCNVDIQDMEGKLVENGPTFVVTRTTPERDTAKSGDTSTRENMKYFIDVAEREINTLCEKHRDEDLDRWPVFCGAAELEAARQDVEAAVHDRMKTRESIDDRQLFLCEVIDNNLEEKYLKELNEAPTRAMNQKITTFAWDDVNGCKLDPAQVREARKAETEYYQKMHVRSLVPVQKCKDATGKDADQGQVDCHEQARRGKSPCAAAAAGTRCCCCWRVRLSFFRARLRAFVLASAITVPLNSSIRLRQISVCACLAIPSSNETHPGHLAASQNTSISSRVMHTLFGIGACPSISSFSLRSLSWSLSASSEPPRSSPDCCDPIFPSLSSSGPFLQAKRHFGSPR